MHGIEKSSLLKTAELFDTFHVLNWVASSITITGCRVSAPLAKILVPSASQHSDPAIEAEYGNCIRTIERIFT